MCRRQPTVVYDDQSWLLLLLIDYAEAVKHTDIQNMIKAVNIKDNTKTLKKIQRMQQMSSTQTS